MSQIYQKKVLFKRSLRQTNSGELEAEIQISNHETYSESSVGIEYWSLDQVNRVLREYKTELSERSSGPDVYLDAAKASISELESARAAFDRPSDFLTQEGNSSAPRGNRTFSSDGEYSTGQKTSKSIKGQTILAYSLGIVGIVALLSNFGDSHMNGTVMIIVAAIWLIILKFRRWWEHG